MSKIELILSIVSFAAAIGAVVTGIFGMNLTSTFESSVFAFYLCTCSSSPRARACLSGCTAFAKSAVFYERAMTGTNE